MKSFIPKKLLVKSHINSPYKGRVKKVKYCCYSEHNGKIYIEQYYNRNFAKTEVINKEDLLLIDGYEKSTNDNIDLYNKAFNIEKLVGV